MKDPENMETPCPCEHCGEWFDLQDGYGSEKWHPNIVICKKCHLEEEAEIENDEEIEGLVESLSEAQWSVKHDTKELAKLRNQPIKLVDASVFPSPEKTISCIVTDGKFQGAHDYLIRPMGSFDPATNTTLYEDEGIPFLFVKKLDDGTFRPGIQTEQLLHMILDRHPKLNEVFAADTHDEFMGHIQGALNCLERRFRERIDRGVAGEHKA
jgi:hypothetical protein